MNISFYMPFKPPGHANPSGDLITGMELYDFLVGDGHRVGLASTLRSRWIYWKPKDLWQAWREVQRLRAELKPDPPDLWLSYHSYYKAPDLLGPACAAKLQVPYVIFQGIYATKHRKRLKTLPGFLLNRRALLAANLVFANKKKDLVNLRRLLPEERICYIAPGLKPEHFAFVQTSRYQIRQQWQAGDRKVVLCTAMFRPGVKSDGVKIVIDSCAQLRQQGCDILLVVIGDGKNRDLLESLGREKLAQHCRFTGKVRRSELFHHYSGADVFAFPGIQESLGMVFLEAQSTGLPVVAYRDWGASEAVVHKQTGLLTPSAQPEQFAEAIKTILTHDETRSAMRKAAASHIREKHDSSKNYRLMIQMLIKTAGSHCRSAAERGSSNISE